MVAWLRSIRCPLPTDDHQHHTTTHNFTAPRSLFSTTVSAGWAPLAASTSAALTSTQLGTSRRPERIKQDILGWPAVAKKNVAAKGAMVPDLDFRSGRRLLRTDVSGAHWRL